MVRSGASQRTVAHVFGVSRATVQLWLERAADVPLERVDWADRPDAPHRTTRTDPAVEDLVLRIRSELREESALGEYGARAIERTLIDRAPPGAPVPSLRTIGRILERHGVVDRRWRHGRPPPPPGWYLPDVAARRSELDSFDTIEDLPGAPRVLTGISLHGGLPAVWPARRVTVGDVVRSLIGHWRDVGLPGYAQFDNAGMFTGSPGTQDAIGPVVRACVLLGVTPVFAPPREYGFQAAVEGLNGRWQAKVWKRFGHLPLEGLRARSDAWVAAVRHRNAVRIEAAPPRRRFPAAPDVEAEPAGRIVLVRRTTDAGRVNALGHLVPVDDRWTDRLVRVELDLARGSLRCFALRRRDPTDQPLIAEHPWRVPSHWAWWPGRDGDPTGPDEP